MAAGAVSSARDPQHNLRWKWLLLALCVLAAMIVVAVIADEFGVGGQPWFGLLQAEPAVTRDAYVAAITQIEPGGPAAKSGLRNGDRIDLHEQSFNSRVRILTELQAKVPLAIRIRRGTHEISATLVGGTVWEASTVNLVYSLLALLSAAWFLACATLIVSRRWWLNEARVLAIVMLCQVGSLLNPIYVVVPSAKLQLLLLATASALVFSAAVLLVELSSRYGIRVAWRRPLEWCAYAANGAAFLVWLAAIIGLATLWFDPLPYLSMIGYAVGGSAVLFSLVIAVPPLTVAVCSFVAVISSTPAHRSRAGWLLLPLPIAIAAYYIFDNLGYLAPSYSLYVFLEMIASICWFLGGLFVSYALLRRRVLDFGFVLNRAVVVSIVGLIVVIAFVLLEWLLGSVLTGVSHATGLIANVALALVIGVSLNYIHKRVDQSVDLVLFRKRHEDEQSLLAFSKEAAYITEWDALLDATLEKIRRHTDARSASVLIRLSGFYSAVRTFGDNTVASVKENDEAILALKVWHKAIDPHHYDTALHAALALPMLSRGKLYGALLLGERAGGEAYAPDEVEALSQLANGVGSALEALSSTTDGGATVLAERVELAIALMGDMIEEIRAARTSSPA